MRIRRIKSVESINPTSDDLLEQRNGAMCFDEMTDKINDEEETANPMAERMSSKNAAAIYVFMS